MSEIDNRGQAAHSKAQKNSPTAKSSATGLSRLLPGKNAAEAGPDEVQSKASNLMALWKSTENEGSVLKRLIKIVAAQPKTERESAETSAEPVNREPASTSMPVPIATKPLPVVPEQPTRAAEHVINRTPALPATQSECNPSYLQQPDSTFLAHTDGPSPMIVVPDSPYIHRRMSRAEKEAAKASKPEPEWHGIALENSTQTSQDSGLNEIPSPDELRQLTTGKHRTVIEPDEPPIPVQNKVSRMTPERSSSERAEIFFTELKIKLKELFAPRL